MEVVDEDEGAAAAAGGGAAAAGAESVRDEESPDRLLKRDTEP